MFPRAKSVRHVKEYDVEVTFANGRKHIVPLWDEVVSKGGEMAEPLRDIAYFKRVRVEKDFGTLEWPNGYDICPDVLYWLATGEPISWATERKYHQPPRHLKSKKTKKRQNRRRVTSGSRR